MKCTLVARGENNKGHRYIFTAASLADAEKFGKVLCRKNSLEYIAVFAGHMTALKFVWRGLSPRVREECRRAQKKFEAAARKNHTDTPKAASPASSAKSFTIYSGDGA